MKDQLKAGIIQHCRSNWTAPLMVDFSIRISVDYTHLKKVIKRDCYPLPSVPDLYAKLISSAPTWLQCFLNGVLRDFLIRFTLGVYLDDIILFSSSLEEHEAHALAVIANLKERNVKTSFKRSQLVSEKIEFLGNTIERVEIKMLPKRATDLQNMKTPKITRHGKLQPDLYPEVCGVSKATLRLHGPQKCLRQFKEKERRGKW